MDDDPERRKRIRVPGKDIRDIMGVPGVMSAIRGNLTAQDEATARLTDLRFNQAFQMTFETFVKTKFPIDFGRIRTFMQDNPSVELWAAGSSVLQAILIQRGLLRNVEEWASSDLDLYVSIPTGWVLGQGGLARSGLAPFVSDFVDLLANMGFRQTKHFEQAQTTFAEEAEHNQNVAYAGGFMEQNHIQDIYTFTHTNGKDIQLVVVGDDRGVSTGRYTVPRVIDNFDLTVCSVGYSFRTQTIYYAIDAPADITAGRMTLRPAYFIKYSQGNYIIHKRISKYTARGFALTNAPPLTLILLNFNRAIRRLTFDSSQAEDMISDYFFGGRLQRARVRPNREYRISARQSILSMQDVTRYEMLIAHNRNSIMFLEARKAEIEAGNLSSVIYAQPRYRVQQKIDVIQKEVTRIKSKLLLPQTADELREITFTESQLPAVPPGAPKTDPARMKRHRFNLARRVYSSARFKKAVCSNDADPYTLSDLGEIFQQYKLFKRVEYRARPDRNGNNSETEDVEDPADLPYTVLCYDITQLMADIARLNDANQPLRWPETRTPIGAYDLIRSDQQYRRYGRYLRFVDFLERKEKLEQSLEGIERGTYWQRKLIGGKTKSMPLRGRPRRKSPRRKSRR